MSVHDKLWLQMSAGAFSSARALLGDAAATNSGLQHLQTSGLLLHTAAAAVDTCKGALQQCAIFKIQHHNGHLQSPVAKVWQMVYRWCA